jgi:hypothetical protein
VCDAGKALVHLLRRKQSAVIIAMRSADARKLFFFGKKTRNNYRYQVISIGGCARSHWSVSKIYLLSYWDVSVCLASRYVEALGQKAG